MSYTKHGEFAKGPWTIRQYGGLTVFDGEGKERTVYTGRHFTINEIGVDVHVLYDGSGLRELYPDGVIMRPEDVREVVALLRAAPELREALRGVIDSYDDTGCEGCGVVGAKEIEYAVRVLKAATTPVDPQEGRP